MPRFLTFATMALPKRIDLWRAKGRPAPVLLYVLPAKEFERAAKKYGHAPSVGAFSVWSNRWWEPSRDLIYLHHDRLDLFGHEWRHVESKKNFHG